MHMAYWEAVMIRKLKHAGEANAWTFHGDLTTIWGKHDLVGESCKAVELFEQLSFNFGSMGGLKGYTE